MGEVVQSAGGVVYFLEGGQPKFLLIKRQAMSKKIERVAPKGKIEPGEAVDAQRCVKSARRREFL
jgi:hypothetical protein